MWAMTSFGILMPAIRPPKTIPYGDTRTLQIRSRRSKDLDILRAKYMPGSLGETIYTPDKDYEYRAYCEPASFAMAMAQIVMEIDYLKFKPTTEDRYQDRPLHEVYNSMWGSLFRAFSTPYHQGRYWSKNPPTKGGTTGRAYTGTGYYSGSRPAGTPAGSADVVYRSGRGAAASDVNTVELPAGDADFDDHRWADPELGPQDDPYWLARDVERVLDAEDERARERAALEANLSDREAGALAAAEVDAYRRHLTTEEIAEALGEQAPPAQMDHSQCEHANSTGANSRCRRRAVRAWERRCAEIQKLVDESLSDAEKDGAFAQ